MTTPVFAQSEDTPAPGGELSLGEDIAAVPATGQAYDKEVFGDWTLRCVKTDTDKEPCQLFQLLRDGQGAEVAEFNLNVLQPGGQAVAGANVITPLETFLPAQLTIRVDQGTAKRYPFAFCNRVGCISRIGLTADDLAGYKRGNAATVTMVPAVAPDQPVNLNLSLTGFTAGLAALQTP